MRRAIFNVFTRDSKIILTSESFKFLLKNCGNNDDVIRCKKTFLKLYPNSDCTVERLYHCINTALDLSLCANSKNNTVSHDIFLDPEWTFQNRHTFLRSLTGSSFTQICGLTNSETYKIFGMLYMDLEGIYQIEDGSGTVIIQFAEECASDCFICDGIFIGCHGCYSSDVFKCNEIFLPKIQKKSKSIDPITSTPDVIVLNGFAINGPNLLRLYLIIDNCLQTCQSLVIVLIGPFNTKIVDLKLETLVKRYPGVELFLIPSKHDLPDFTYPLKMGHDKTQSEKSIKWISNPCIISLFGRSLYIMNDNYIEQMLYTGHFHSKETKHELIAKTCLSQHAYNHYRFKHATMKTLPDVFIVGQSFYNFCTVINGVSFCGIGGFSINSFSFLKYNVLKDLCSIHSTEQ